MTTSELLKQYRLRANKTQKEWVGSTVSPSFYSKVEKGLNHISADNLIDLLDHNGISAANFFSELRPKRKLQYERERELINLLVNAYYQNSNSKFEQLKRVIELEKLPHQNNLFTLAKSLSALAKSNIEKLDDETKAIIKREIFSLRGFDKQSLAIYCAFMQLYNIDDNLLIARKIVSQFQNSTDVEIQKRILGIIGNLLFLCIENKRYDETKPFVKVANNIPTIPELCFYKDVLLVPINLLNYHFTKEPSYIDNCLKAIDFLSFIGMPAYSKELTKFFSENK